MKEKKISLSKDTFFELEGKLGPEDRFVSEKTANNGWNSLVFLTCEHNKIIFVLDSDA